MIQLELFASKILMVQHFLELYVYLPRYICKKKTVQSLCWLSPSECGVSGDILHPYTLFTLRLPVRSSHQHTEPGGQARTWHGTGDAFYMEVLYKNLIFLFF